MAHPSLKLLLLAAGAGLAGLSCVDPVGESAHPDAPFASALEAAILPPVLTFTVVSPAAIAGQKPAARARFGPELFDVSAPIFYIGEACEPILAIPKEKIILALIERGTCTFALKVQNAELAGFIGAVVFDNQEQADPMEMGWDFSTVVAIPSLFITRREGLVLREQLDADIPVVVHLLSTLPVPDATPVGEDVNVSPTDQTTGEESPIDLVFDNVTTSGTTTVTSTGTGTPPPTGFKLGSPPVYYEIATTAEFDGAIEICIDYNSDDFSRPARLRLFHRDGGGGWDDVTTSNDPVAGRICGTVTSLSPFALFESQYVLNGLQSPVDNPPVLNTVKAGQAIPVKFSLGGDWGLDIFASGSPSVRVVSCDAGAPTDIVEQTLSAGESGLSYDAFTETYRYVWKTVKGWTGCRELALHFKDGQVQTARFKF